MTPSLVIFDFDGTLVDTQEVINKLEWEIFLNHVLKMSLQDYTERFSGETALSIIRRLRKENNVIFSKKASLLAKDIDKAVLSEFSKRKITPIKEVKNLLKMLQVRKCVASNCSQLILRTLLSASSLAFYFNGHVFSADMVKRPKPYPDLFLFAIHSMDIKSSQGLIIEDSEVGIKAAVAAGMTAWVFFGQATSSQEWIVNC